jgi:hypothetical protein
MQWHVQFPSESSIGRLVLNATRVSAAVNLNASSPRFRLALTAIPTPPPSQHVIGSSNKSESEPPLLLLGWIVNGNPSPAALESGKVFGDKTLTSSKLTQEYKKLVP